MSKRKTPVDVSEEVKETTSVSVTKADAKKVPSGTGARKKHVAAVKETKKTVKKAKSDVAAVESPSDAVVEKARLEKSATTEVTRPPRQIASKRKASPLNADRIDTFVSGHEAVGPPTAELKEKFSAQKIPLQVDFANLIDVADCGRKAVGLSPSQPGGLGVGMMLDAESRLAVLPGMGINVSAAGVGVTTEANKGLSVDVAGVAVKLEVNKGLTVGPNGIAIKPSAGIVVDGSGVGLAVSQQFLPGMIMMFSGSTVPTGWALCDGSNNTPNLINRFILAGPLAERGTSGGGAITGSGNGKTYDGKTTSSGGGVPVAITVNGTALNVNQIPKHRHLGGARYINYQDDGQWTEYGFESRPTNSRGVDVDRSSPYALAYTSDVGSSQSHAHTAQASLPNHTHTMDILPAYYVLAFIMKL